MTRFLGIVAALLLTVALGTAAASTADTNSTAKLRVVDLSPLKVAGVRFKAGEGIRVTLRVEGARLGRQVQASPTGSFTASFPRTSVDRCSADIALDAIGAHGSRAQLKLPQLACPPAL